MQKIGPGDRLVHASDRFDLPPGTVRPEQPWRRNAVIANSPESPWRRRSRCARMPRSTAPHRAPGFLVAHLDVMEPPGDLRESRMDDQLPRRAQGTIGPAGQVRQVRQQPRSVGIVGRERADDHGVGGPQRDDRLNDGLAVVVGLMSLLHQPQDVRKVLGPVRDPARRRTDRLVEPRADADLAR